MTAMMSRRLLLRFSAALGALLAFHGSAAAELLFVRPLRKERPRVRLDPFTEGGKALVGVGGEGSVEERVREAVALIGGLRKLDIRGKTVLVKPNVVSGSPSPTTTSPELVAAAVRLLYREGAREVVVGDMSALLYRATLKNMRKCGILQAAEKAGARVVAFEDAGWIEVPLPGARYLEKAYVTEWLYRADLFINLPVVKTHHSATYSICLKNFIGCTHLKQRPYLVDRSHWEELVAEFNLACRPDLNIVDATVAMIEGGPWEGTPSSTGIVIASGDRVAADVVGLGLIRSFGRWQMVTGKGVWEQRQIRHALLLGLGKGKGEIVLRTGDGDERFRELMRAVRRETGL
jgi:uncharacterized protein (DUF362 family)